MEGEKKMRTTLALLAVSVIIIMGLAACGEDEPSYYDIVVENDAWLFGTCRIYLDGTFQFELEVGDNDVIEQVRGGKHTLAAKDDDNDIVAKQTFELENDIRWSVSDNLSLDWLFDW